MSTMTNSTNPNEAYFHWLCKFVYDGSSVQYNRLLEFLFQEPFIWMNEMDKNRAVDGQQLRLNFENETGLKPLYEEACTMLEMMVALSLKCESWIMADPDKGDRTSEWFWTMIVSLGLGGMSDEKFDEFKCRNIVKDFIYGNYEKNGKGGLFTITGDKDMTRLNIWYQLQAYLNEMQKENL